MRKAFPNDLAGVYTSEEMETVKEEEAKEKAAKLKAEEDKKNAEERAEKARLEEEQRQELISYMDDLITQKGKTATEVLSAIQTVNPKIKSLAQLDTSNIQKLITKLESYPDYISEEINTDEIPL